jgi:hypothetical protein
MKREAIDQEYYEVQLEYLEELRRPPDMLAEAYMARAILEGVASIACVLFAYYVICTGIPLSKGLVVPFVIFLAAALYFARDARAQIQRARRKRQLARQK